MKGLKVFFRGTFSSITPLTVHAARHWSKVTYCSITPLTVHAARHWSKVTYYSITPLTVHAAGQCGKATPRPLMLRAKTQGAQERSRAGRWRCALIAGWVVLLLNCSSTVAFWTL